MTGASGKRERITLQTYSTASDGAGGTVETWADLTHVPKMWAEVMAGNGDERMDEGAFNAQGVWTFVISNRSDVSELDRVIWRGDYYNVKQVRRLGHRPHQLALVTDRGRVQ